MQTHPGAINLSRIVSQLRAYGVLAEVSLCCPPLQGRFSTHYSPVRHCPLSEDRFSFDLHVWSTPPAFVLSQDQTLRCQKSLCPMSFNLSNDSSTSSFVFVLVLSVFFLKSTGFYRFQLFCFQCALTSQGQKKFFSLLNFRTLNSLLCYPITDIFESQAFCFSLLSRCKIVAFRLFVSASDFVF